MNESDIVDILKSTVLVEDFLCKKHADEFKAKDEEDPLYPESIRNSDAIKTLDSIFQTHSTREKQWEELYMSKIELQKLAQVRQLCYNFGDLL